MHGQQNIKKLMLIVKKKPLMFVRNKEIFNPESFYTNSCIFYCRLTSGYIKNVWHFSPHFLITLLISAVGIVTCYRLDGPGIEFRWWPGFIYPSRPHSLLYNGYRNSPQVKTTRAWRWPTPSSADGKERVELYHKSPVETSFPLLMYNLRL